MPLSFHAAPPCLRASAFLRLRPGIRVHSFSSSAASFAQAREPTHYETLNVPTTATALEIKKQFYALSLTHHPDKNPNDPQAHSRFSSISAAYQILGSSAKRARYDQDNGIHRQAAATTTAAGSSGLHSNMHRGSYVGSRPPSGLSKRRGQFRGPPPSFYAHGGYGNTNHGHGHYNHPHHAHPHPHQSSSSSSPFSRSSSGRRTSPTEDHTSFVYSNPIHHFDASSHFRTQTAEDTRRRIRRAKTFQDAKEQARARGIDPEEEVGSTSARFFGVMGIVALALLCANIARSIEPMPQSMRKSVGISKPRGAPQEQHKDG